MGPLQGCRVIEFAGIGPGPFCGMLLADGANMLMAAFHLTANDTPAASAGTRFRYRKPDEGARLHTTGNCGAGRVGHSQTTRH